MIASRSIWVSQLQEAPLLPLSKMLSLDAEWREEYIGGACAHLEGFRPYKLEI